MALKIQRQILSTLLVIVEGATEFAFCRFLKDSLSHGKNIKIQIKDAHGGSPDKIVEFAARQMKQFPHDFLLIMFDTDRVVSAESEKIIKRLKAKTFRFSPCIEGFFLEVMGHTKSSDTFSCKNRFHQIGLSEKDKLSHEEYRRIFPMEQLATWCQHPDFERLKKYFANETDSIKKQD